MKKVGLKLFFIISFITFVTLNVETSYASTVDVESKTLMIETGNKAILNTSRTKGYKLQKINYNLLKVQSSNKKIATVNKYGIVTGKKEGKVTITIFFYKKNNKLKKKFLYTIYVKEKIDDADKFQYSIKTQNDNTSYINITKYIGDEAIVNVPSSIGGIPVKSFSAPIYNSIIELNFADNIEEISYMICSGKACDTLKSVHLPSNLNKLASWAFYGCSSLSSINYEEVFDLGAIPPYCFAGCKSLTGTLDIPSNVSEIGQSAFSSCGFTSLNLNNGLKTIFPNAFEGSKITSISLPESVECVGTNAFGSLTLNNFTIANPNTTLDGNVFENSRISVDSCFIKDKTLCYYYKSN